MRALVLGGTQFVGRHIVQALLDAGHEVSIFHRGKTNPDLFPEADHILGDRNGELSALERSFDACIDVSGYTLTQVEKSLSRLANRTDRYLFISTVSVYQVPVPPGFTEEAPTEDLDDPYVDLSAETYGGLKAACERAVRDTLGEDRALVYRLGLVNGPWDNTDRATYWSLRAAEGGEILVPSAPDTPFQIIDARDIGGAVVHGLTNSLSGAYSIVNDPVTWEDWLETSRRVTAPHVGSGGAGPTEYVWADDPDWVEAQMGDFGPDSPLGEARPRGALPMYLPKAYGWEFWQASNAKARHAGIRFRPLHETIAATTQWRVGESEPVRAGLEPEQEKELIERWRKRG